MSETKRTKAEIDLLREGYVTGRMIHGYKDLPDTYMQEAVKVYPYPKKTVPKIISVSNSTWVMIKDGKLMYNYSRSEPHPDSPNWFKGLWSTLTFRNLVELIDNPTKEVDDV